MSEKVCMNLQHNKVGLQQVFSRRENHKYSTSYNIIRLLSCFMACPSVHICGRSEIESRQVGVLLLLPGEPHFREFLDSLFRGKATRLTLQTFAAIIFLFNHLFSLLTM